MSRPTARLSPEDWMLAGFRGLAASGPKALNAEALARTLGVSKGSFYWHFKDLADFKARMLGFWHDQAFAAVVQAAEAGGTATQKLYRLVELIADDDPAHGGMAAEPAIRAWAQEDQLVAEAVARIDGKRLDYLSRLLGELGLRNPDFARIIYGGYIGMGTLSAADGLDNAGALSTLMAAILAVQDA